MLTLVIGNKRYSSWSLRPWILMKAFDIPFEEILVPLYQADSKPTLLAHSPAGKVPVLRDGAVVVWESLAIIEYLAELRPDLAIWPRDKAQRAQARALACEMHAGFSALRNECGMNFGRAPRALPLTALATADARRIDDAWRDALARSGGPFLFGAFCAADAMFAPVAQRFECYGVPVSDDARRYMARVTALGPWAEWRRAALAEEWRLPAFEKE